MEDIYKQLKVCQGMVLLNIYIGNNRIELSLGKRKNGVILKTVLMDTCPKITVEEYE